MVVAIRWCPCSSRRCVGVCALRIDSMVESWMRQDVCRNMGVTNGLCDVLDALSVDALMEDVMR